MKLTELLLQINNVAQTGGDAAHCEALAREAVRIADMVGWSTGPIDPDGLLLNRLASLQDDLTHRQDTTRDDGLAILNDALTRLGRAIARHDEDLDPDTAGEDGGEDFS